MRDKNARIRRPHIAKMGRTVTDCKKMGRTVTDCKNCSFKFSQRARSLSQTKQIFPDEMKYFHAEG